MSALHERLEGMVGDAILDEIEELEMDAVNATRFERLAAKAVDLLAALGAIDNNPHAKFLYMQGDREL